MTCATAGPRGWPHLMPLWYVLRAAPGRRERAAAVGVDVCRLPEGAQPRARPARDAAGRGGRGLPGAARGDARVRGGHPPRAARSCGALGHEIFARYATPRGEPPADELPAEVAEMVDKQAAKRVGAGVRRAHARDLGPPQARRGLLRPPAARGAGTAAAAGRVRRHGAAEGTDPLRGQGHAPAPDHAHERQAARAGRQQAGAVLRDRGDGRGGHRGGRDHHRAGDGRRDPSRPPATARASACASPTSSRTSRSASPTRCSPPSRSSATARS